MAKKKPSKNSQPRRQGSNGLTRTQRIEIFAQGIVTKNLSQSDAYREAYPSSLKWAAGSVHARASELAKDSKVLVRIETLKAKMIKRYDATIDRVLAELTNISFFNPADLYDDDGKPIPLHKLPREVACVITGFHIDKNSNKEDYLKSFRTVSKERGLELLGKWFKMWSDDAVPITPGGGEPNVNFNVDASKMSPEKAVELYRRLKD